MGKHKKQITEEDAKKIDRRIKKQNDGNPPAVSLGKLLNKITNKKNK